MAFSRGYIIVAVIMAAALVSCVIGIILFMSSNPNVEAQTKEKGPMVTDKVNFYNYATASLKTNK